MICSLCGFEIARFWDGGWKNGDGNEAYFAHHGLCPKEKAALWAMIEAEKAKQSPVEPEKPEPDDSEQCECGAAGCVLENPPQPNAEVQ